MSAVFFYLVIFVIFILSLRLKSRDNQTLLEKPFTDSIKNLFIFLIVFLHMFNAIPYDGLLSNELLLFRKILGQACVAPFFFISGFGIFEGYKKNGSKYNKSIFINHFLKILLFSFLCLIPYIIYDVVTNGFRPFYIYPLCSIGLATIGNPTWFVFAILFVYFISWLVGLIKFKKLYLNLVIISLFIIVYIVVLKLLHFEPYWYDTIIMFSVGGLFSILLKKINSLLSKKVLSIFLIVLPLPLYIFAWYELRKVNFLDPLGMFILSTLLIISITAFSKWFTAKGIVFLFFGKNSWPLYYLHLLFIMIFSSLSLNNTFQYLLIIVSSLIAAFAYTYFFKLIEHKLFQKN